MTLAFLSDTAMADALREMGALPTVDLTIATDYVSAIRSLRARRFDRLILGAVAGHSARYPLGHYGARDAGEIVEYMIEECPQDLWPAGVLLVNAGPDYAAHIMRRLRMVGVPCELIEVAF